MYNSHPSGALPLPVRYLVAIVLGLLLGIYVDSQGAAGLSALHVAAIALMAGGAAEGLRRLLPPGPITIASIVVLALGVVGLVLLPAGSRALAYAAFAVLALVALVALWYRSRAR